MRRWLVFLLGVLLVHPAMGQDGWPKQSIRLVVPYPPGGPADVMSRLVAERLTQALGVTVIVDNKSGGSGTVGAEIVRQAAPDGYTLLAAPSVFVLGPHVLRSVPYDPLSDFTPIMRYGEGALFVLANPSAVPGATIADALPAIRARPRAFAFGLSAFGAANHLAVLDFQRLAQQELLIVPYRGSASALADLISGQVQLMIDPIIAALPFVRDGRLKALAITARERSKVAPQVPTAAESGMPGLEFASWYGVWGPRGLPASIVSRLADAIGSMARDPAIVERSTALGFDLISEGPEPFARYIKSDVARNVCLLKAANYKPE